MQNLLIFSHVGLCRPLYVDSLVAYTNHSMTTLLASSIVYSTSTLSAASPHHFTLTLLAASTWRYMLASFMVSTCRLTSTCLAAFTGRSMSTCLAILTCGSARSTSTPLVFPTHCGDRYCDTISNSPNSVFFYPSWVWGGVRIVYIVIYFFHRIMGLLRIIFLYPNSHVSYIFHLDYSIYISCIHNLH